jgi:hypothetical protein
MSIKFLHQVIIFAAMSVSLLFAAYCFFDPSAGGPVYIAAGVVCVGLAIALVFYEIHFLKRTRKIIIH